MEALVLKTRLSRREGEWAILFFCLYFVTAKFGLSLSAINHFAALVWIPTGLAIAAVYFLGNRFAFIVVLSAFFVNFSSGAPFISSGGIAAGNALEALVGAAFLYQVEFNPLLSRLRDALALITIGLIAPVVSASIGVASLALTHSIDSSSIGATWTAWWLGDALGVFVVASFLFKWIRRPLLPSVRSEILEWASILALTIAMSYLFFFVPAVAGGGLPVTYPLLIPLTWGALRIGPRGVTLQLLLMAGLAVSGTVVSAHGNPALLFPVQSFLGIYSAIFLIVTATAEERRQSTRALERHVEQLERALTQIKTEDEAKTDFVAVIAHELRNPLAPLLSSLEIMRLTRELDDKSKRLVNAMRGRVRTMARLLDDLLDISRITQRKLTVNKEKIDLRRIIDRAVETIEPQLKTERHRLTIDVPKTTIEFFGDAVRLEQVVVNLLTNAIKYTPPGGKISLLLEANYQAAIIRVKDTGTGITPEVMQTIFKPFAQGAAARRAMKGLGIGLALSKSLVEMHGGTIEAKSAGAGKGSEFTVRLPLTAEKKEGPMRAHEETRELKYMSPLSKSMRISIIDDNEAAADTLAELLEHFGHQVKVGYTGTAAVEEIPAFNPHVAILDIGLPDIDGYEVAKRLREMGVKAIFIALTGYGQNEDRERSREAGFAYHLVKPVGIVDLENVLKQLTQAR